MRLIDADKLKSDISETRELLKKGLGEDAKFAYMTAHAVLNKIDAQLTAYDMNKVVEQLEEHFNSTDDKNIRLAYHHAIEIVKAGGVKDKEN